jgi:hypothetical protein
MALETATKKGTKGYASLNYEVQIYTWTLSFFSKALATLKKKHDLLLWGHTTKHEQPIKCNTCLGVVARQYKKNIFNFFWMSLNYD